MKTPTLMPVTLRAFQHPLFLLISLVMGVGLFWSITLFNDYRSGASSLFQGGIGNYLKETLFFNALFEVVSFLIFMQVAPRYLHLFRITHIKLNLKSVLIYELLFLPCILGSIIIFSPLTNGIRYLFLFYPYYSWETYFPTYFFQQNMFLTYLNVLLPFGYIYLNSNLLLDYNEWKYKNLQHTGTPDQPMPLYIKAIEAWDDLGETILSLQDIIYIEVESNNYFAYTKGRTYNIRKNLSELEAELNPQQFYRINRSVILNLSFLKTYTFLKNDKYIVRLNDSKTEFVMQRARIKELKKRLNETDPTA